MPNVAEDYLPDEPVLRILRILQVDGRITNQELAQRVGMSPATSFERVNRLRVSGIITAIPRCSIRGG